MSYVQINHEADFAKDFTIKGSNAKPGESAFDPDVRVRPYKTWNSSRISQTDISSRIAAGKLGRNAGIVKSIISPRIFYEQQMIKLLSKMDKSGKELNFEEAHTEAVKSYVRYLKTIEVSSKVEEQINHELASIKSGAVMEDMMERFTTARGAKITLPPGGLVSSAAERGLKPAQAKSPGVAYAQYQSGDGETYTFRTHYAVKGELRPDTPNIILHVISELVKGGNIVAPLAAAGIKLQDSSSKVVADFPEIFKALGSDSFDDGDEYPAPEGE